MKKLLFYILGWILLAVPLSYAQTMTPDILANGQTSTGASANTCTAYGFQRISVFFVISGTSASVDIECDDGSGTWYTLSGTGLPVTTIGNTILAISAYACTKFRTNVTACNSCNVTTKCNKWKSGR